MERVSSIFSQIVKLVPRGLFAEAVTRHQGEKHAKGMTCWSQFVAMQFCHPGGARSLREITGGLAASEGKLRHLGVLQPPTRSTLSYANGHRSWQIYGDWGDWGQRPRFRNAFRQDWLSSSFKSLPFQGLSQFPAVLRGAEPSALPEPV